MQNYSPIRNLRNKFLFLDPIPADTELSNDMLNRIFCKEFTYKPFKKIDKPKVKPENILNKVQFCINLLTPEKYDEIKKSLFEIPINTIDMVTDMVSKMISLFVQFPAYSSVYARLCNDIHLENKYAISGQQGLFRSKFLNQCQLSFLQMKEQFGKPVENLEDRFKQKTARTGLAHLIAELYLIGFFPQNPLFNNIIFDICKLKLSSLPSEDEIEFICALLSKCGNQIDKVGKKFMDDVFGKIAPISKDKNFGSRIRCMIMDIIDLRGRNWQQKNAIVPTTIQGVLDQKNKEQEEIDKKVKESLKKPKGKKHSNAPIKISIPETSIDEEFSPRFEHEKDIQLNIKSYFEDGDVDSCIESIDKYIPESPIQTISVATKITLISREEAHDDYLRLVSTLLDNKKINSSTLVSSFKDALIQLKQEDVIEDFPKLPSIVSRLRSRIQEQYQICIDDNHIPNIFK